jgi:hypothetical protein
MTPEQFDYLTDLVKRANDSQDAFDKWLEEQDHTKRYDDAMKGVGL